MNRSTKFCIEWTDLSYAVDERQVSFKAPFNLSVKKQKKTILQSQSGCLQSGTLTALMGPSGAGKTTLLNCLTARIKTGWNGSIMFKSNLDGSQDNSDADLKMAFVPQKDHLYDQLTVRETIRFAIRFKNISKNMSIDEREKRVEKTASDLNLISCLDTKVSKLSGGQAKRVSVAVELVSTPNFLVLDEPTSGLDSTNALIIMKVIKRLLDRDAISGDIEQVVPPIICSIHQPSFECLKLFDQIYLLSECGEKIFFDSPVSVPPFLKSAGMALPDHCNPADYMLDLCYRQVSASDADQKSEGAKSGEAEVEFDGFENQSFQVKYKPEENSDPNAIIGGAQHYHQRSFDESKFEVVTLSNNNDRDIYLVKKSIIEAANETQRNLRSTNWYSFLLLLLYRNLSVLKSSPAPLAIRLIFCFINLIIPFMYNHSLGSHDGCWDSILEEDHSIKNKSILDLIVQMPKDGDKSTSYVRRMEQVGDNVTFILMMTNFALYFHCLITVSVIPIEAKIIQKEIYNNWYTINSYIAGRFIFFLPLMMIQISIFVIVSFLVSNQIFGIERWSLAIASFIFQAWIAEMVGVTIGAFLPGNVIASTILAIIYSFPIIVFGGYFVRVASAHDFVSWFMWVSQLRHAFEAALISVYGLGRCSSEDGTAITANDMSSPQKMMERFFSDYDISHRDAKFISPILGIPNDYCVAEVINATRDYLGLHHYDSSDTSDYDSGYNSFESDAEVVDESLYSFPMTSFGLHDNDLYRCFYWLVFLTLCYIAMAVFSVRRLIKN